MRSHSFKKTGSCLLLTGFLFLLTACGSESAVRSGEASVARDNKAYVTQNAQADAAEDPADAGREDTGGEPAEDVEQGRKLIKNVNLEVETLDFDGMSASIGQQAKKLGGYVESSNVRGGGYYGKPDELKSADYTVRVPVDKLDSFVKKVEEGGSVLSKSESVTDITLDYVDTESRKKALEAEQEKMFELLGQAESIDAVIAIEERLSEIRYEIENYGSQLKTYDNQISYSTVYISLREARLIAAKGGEGTLKRIAVGFSNNVVNVLRGIRELLIGFIIILPYLFVIGIFGLIVYLIVRVLLKREKKMREKKLQDGRSELQGGRSGMNGARNEMNEQGKR